MWPRHKEELRNRRINPYKARLTHGLLVMDRRAIVVSYNGQEINLGKKEFLMLELLLLNIGDTLAYEDFLSYLYRSPDEEPCPRTIDSFIFLIRRKLRYAGAPREFIESGHPQGSPGTYFLREEECAVAA